MVKARRSPRYRWFVTGVAVLCLVAPVEFGHFVRDVAVAKANTAAQAPEGAREPVGKTARAKSSKTQSRNRARVTIENGIHYVGQAIAVTVTVSAERVRPEITPPKLAPAEAFLVPDSTDFRPIVSTAIGDAVDEANRFTYRYYLVPRRAGTFVLAPFVLRLGERSFSTEPARLAVRALPVAGRPNSFLGGVGVLDVAAFATPASVRVGQVLEYGVTLTGPGALGSRRPPDTSRLAGLDIAPRVELLPTDDPVNSKERRFRYRLRPMRAGVASLPPVVVSWFDPKAGRYMTKASEPIMIRVADVARFDSSRLSYESQPAVGGIRTVIIAVATGTIGLGLAVTALAWARWRRRARRPSTSRLLERMLQDLEVDRGPEALGKAIHDGLVAFLEVAADRPPGALTPREARMYIAAVTGEEELGEMVANLIADCDRAQFACSPEAQANDTFCYDLGCTARVLYASLAEKACSDWERNGAKPRRDSVVDSVGR